MDDSNCVAPPSAMGILQCLKLLAQEAGSLNLMQTVTAIEDALEMAASETGMDAKVNMQRQMTRHLVH